MADLYIYNNDSCIMIKNGSCVTQINMMTPMIDKKVSLYICDYKLNSYSIDLKNELEPIKDGVLTLMKTINHILSAEDGYRTLSSEEILNILSVVK